MKIPARIQPLVDDGLVDEVISRLRSGKEADVYVVRCGNEVRCAKIYKEATQRNFKQAVQYQEGRKTRNSRNARAMRKGSKFGRKQQEQVWQTTEIDALWRLSSAGVRVPQPYDYLDGVLLMELISNDEGQVAPRLSDISLSAVQALQDHAIMMKFITRMLCIGLIHGDLSEFNVLMHKNGPVIIDLPQVVDASASNHARAMLERDINNITHYYAQYAPELSDKKYDKEIWALYETGKLTVDTELTGHYEEKTVTADVSAILEVIKSAQDEENERQRELNSKGDY